MKKRLLMFTCVLGLTLSALTACGGGNSNVDTQSEVSSQQSESTQTETETHKKSATLST